MKNKWMIGLLLAAVLTVGAVFSGVTAAFADTVAGDKPSVKAKAALMLDFDTGTVVYEHNPTERFQIASMVKIMTLNLIYDEIDAGRLSFDTDINAGPNATAMGGSQAFLDTNNTYKAGELIKSIIVASANDSCVAMAEHIAGSVEGFVARMNDRVRTMGLANTYFVNCTGLPAPNQYSCAADVAQMSRTIFARPDFTAHAGIWMYDFVHPSGRITGLTNTNKLIRFYEGCDGGKTGFTSEALSCLSATAKRGNTRFISVVIGAPDSKTRNAEMAKLFNHGFANYETQPVLLKGAEAEGAAAVSRGKSAEVKGYIAEDVVVFKKKSDGGQYRTETRLAPLCAPVKKNDKIGEIVLYKGDETVRTVDVLAVDSVDKSGYPDIVGNMTKAW
ncbi:MAG: D-alanyl-D-alanine carboxypeptidase [Clostridiales bacterium]|nr:D-alanyl-D-alanine carboxypeptidase [Clostridiales bacterium]